MSFPSSAPESYGSSFFPFLNGKGLSGRGLKKLASKFGQKRKRTASQPKKRKATKKSTETPKEFIKPRAPSRRAIHRIEHINIAPPPPSRSALVSAAAKSSVSLLKQQQEHERKLAKIQSDEHLASMRLAEATAVAKNELKRKEMVTADQEKKLKEAEEKFQQLQKQNQKQQDKIGELKEEIRQLNVAHAHESNEEMKEANPIEEQAPSGVNEVEMMYNESPLPSEYSFHPGSEIQNDLDMLNSIAGNHDRVEQLKAEKAGKAQRIRQHKSAEKKLQLKEKHKRFYQRRGDGIAYFPSQHPRLGGSMENLDPFVSAGQAMQCVIS